MSSPLLVKISRDGKEIGTYEAKEAVRLLVYGTLKETDFYWHEGMGGEGELLSKLDTSEGLRLPAEPEVKSQSDNESESTRACTGGCGLLIFLIGGFFSVKLFLDSREMSNGFYERDIAEWVAKGLGAISLIWLFIAIACYYFRKK
jgi:hypothetical protein